MTSHISKCSSKTTLPGQGAPALSLAEISLRLGGNGEVSASGWARGKCPAHHGSGDNLAFKQAGPDQLIVKCHSYGCAPDEVVPEINARCGTRFRVGRASASEEFADYPEIPGALNGSALDLEAKAAAEALALWLAELDGYKSMLRRDSAERIFARAKPIERGDLADIYLRGRGLALEQYPAALRLHPALWHKESRQLWPAILAQVTGSNRKPVTVHRTFLDPQTPKKAPIGPPRKLFSSMRGGAVRLFDPGGDTLLIGEGIETVLAALVLSGWRYAGWAALSTSGFSGLAVPLPRFKRIVIAADNDRGGTGLRAAKALAKRLRAAGRPVDIRMPEAPGADWNDVLVQQSRKGPVR